MRDKKIPMDKLVIKTQLKKNIGDYEAIGPHVAVAKEMLKRGIPIDAGTMIEYVVAPGKPKDKIRDKAKLPEDVKNGEYDIDYYINNQMLHAVGNIFEVFNIDLKEFAEGKKQKKLLDF